MLKLQTRLMMSLPHPQGLEEQALQGEMMATGAISRGLSPKEVAKVVTQGLEGGLGQVLAARRTEDSERRTKRTTAMLKVTNSSLVLRLASDSKLEL